MMMHALLRRNLACLFSNNSSSPGKSHLSFSLYVLYFSTSRESKPLNTPAVYEFLLHKHQLSPEVASHVASVLTHLKNPEKCDSILSFFKEIGFTKAQLEKTLKFRPCLLSASPEKIIKPKIKIFQDLGFSAKDIAHIISNEPGILHASANNRVIPALSLLKGLLGSNEEVAKALRKSGWSLLTDLEKNMVPIVKILKSCGITMEQITKLLNYFPRFLLYKPEIMRKCVDKVNEMGVNMSSKMFIYALGVVGSMTNGIWELKLQAFRNLLGFSEDDILRVFRQDPQVFTVSENKMKMVKEVLLTAGKYKTSCTVKYPKSLMYSIEKQYKPRFEVLEILESPYINEVGDVYLAHRALNDKREVKLISTA